MPDYELNLCRTCMQMTNHLNGVCQKCKVGAPDNTEERQKMKQIDGLLCSDCGRTANNMTCIKKYGQAAKQEAFSVSTMRKGTCCVCGQVKHVTEQRDFFYPDARALKLLRQYLTKGKIKEEK